MVAIGFVWVVEGENSDWLGESKVRALGADAQMIQNL